MISRAPSPALAPFISQLWYVEAPELSHRRERVLPSTDTQLLVNLDEDRLSWWGGDSLSVGHPGAGALVGGIYDRPIAIDTAEQRRLVGAVVRAGAAPVVFGVNAEALAGAHVAADDLFVHARLRERLLEAEEPERILSVLEAFLARRVAGRLDPAVMFARNALDRGARVRSVAEGLGWSTKRFRQRFAAQVGVPPKRYARIARLQRVVAAAAKVETVRWAELAADAGYYDQAHLIAEFRALTGLTPSAYRPRAPDEQNHVVLDR